MEHVFIKKPNLSNVSIEKVANMFFNNKRPFYDFIEKTENPVYLYWDKVKYKNRPEELTAEEFWSFVKFYRKAKSEKTLIQDEDGAFFSWIKVQRFEKFFHDLDLNTGGVLFSINDGVDDKTKQQIISRGIMEEAVASSILEGAHSTRKAAKKFLREKRIPTNKSEHMILNNFIAMQEIEERFKNEKLNKNLLFELHSIITKNTLDEEDDVGRLRNDNDDIIVGTSDGRFLLHVPPKRIFMEKELEKLINFANDEVEGPFVHPVIKAIIIHFWIGYLHPFCDGNGRMARLLFYWYLLKNSYWGFSYLPISTIIRKSPEQYKNAYLYSEQDDNDLTYFIDYNIRKIQQSMKEFKKYMEEKMQESSSISEVLKEKYNLNERQIGSLKFHFDNKDGRTTPTVYMNIYKVSKMTAINDLKALVNHGFLKKINKEEMFIIIQQKK